MEYGIDWTLDENDFYESIRTLIDQAHREGAVLPLPFKMEDHAAGVDILMALISQVNCEGCDAPCCKENPNGEPLALLKPDYLRLRKIYSAEMLSAHGIKIEPGQYEGVIPMPCPFLTSVKRCSCYPYRPFACIVFPLQNPARDDAGSDFISLASNCPEARRIVLAVYMYSWKIRRTLGEMAGAEVDEYLKAQR